MIALSYAGAAFFVVFALILAGLILTRRIDFPLLFDTGMAVLAIGAVLMAEAIASQADGQKVAWRTLVMLAGWALIYTSTRREKKKRACTEPRDMTNEAMSQVHGGKK